MTDKALDTQGCKCQSGWMCPACADSLRTRNEELEGDLGERAYHRKKHFEFRDLWKKEQTTNKRLTEALEAVEWVRGGNHPDTRYCPWCGATKAGRGSDC